MPRIGGGACLPPSMMAINEVARTAPSRAAPINQVDQPAINKLA